MAWSNTTATDVARQFLTVGPVVQPFGDVDFILTVDESHPIYLSDVVQPYILLTDTPTEIP